MDVGQRLDPGRHRAELDLDAVRVVTWSTCPHAQDGLVNVSRAVQCQGVIPILGSRSEDAVCILYLLDAGPQDHGELSGSGFLSRRVERFGCGTVGKLSRVCSMSRSGIEVYCGQD